MLGIILQLMLVSIVRRSIKNKDLQSNSLSLKIPIMHKITNRKKKFHKSSKSWHYRCSYIVDITDVIEIVYLATEEKGGPFRIG